MFIKREGIMGSVMVGLKVVLLLLYDYRFVRFLYRVNVIWNLFVK